MSVTINGLLQGTQLEGYTDATLPAVGKTGRLARLTDTTGGLVMDTGEQWMALAQAVNVQDAPFGALADLETVSDGVMSASSTTLTSATAAFVAADVGKTIRVQGAGALGSSKTVSSITRSGTTATVTTSTAHGYVIGQYVVISGADQADYNGNFLIVTRPSTTTFTYTVANSPVTPATGTMAAASPAPLATTIAAFVSATEVTLTGSATTAVGVADESAAVVHWGTDNTTAIQAAITAVNAAGGGGVFIPPGTYGVGNLTGASNVTIFGAGEASVLKALTTTTGSGLTPGVITFTSVNDAGVHSLKIDGSARGSVTGNFNSTYGIGVLGTGTRLRFRDLWIYDAYYMGLWVRGGTNIQITNLRVSAGVQSNGLLLGANTSDETDVKNVTVNNVLVHDTIGEGVGVWANGGGASVTQDVTLNNVIIRNISTMPPSSGHGLWGSTGATRVTVTNFVIDGVGTGDGIHFEHLSDWSLSNGVVNGVTGNFYGISFQNNSSSYQDGFNLSNIVVRGGASQGVVLGPYVRNATLTSIISRGNASTGFGLGGQDIRVVNCHALGNGSSADGFGVTGAADFLATNIQVSNCRSAGGNIGFRVISNVTSVYFGVGNKFEGTTSGVSWAGSLLAAMHGTTAAVRLRETVAAGDAYEVPVFAAKDGAKVIVTNAYLMFGADITQDDTDYNTYTLTRRDADGSGAVTMKAVTTKTTGGLDFNDFSRVLLGAISNPRLETSHNVSLAKTVGGAGQAEADGLLILDYIEY